MDSQEGIDQVCIIDYFDRTKIDGYINRQSRKRYQRGTWAGISYRNQYVVVKALIPC